MEESAPLDDSTRGEIFHIWKLPNSWMNMNILQSVPLH